MKPFSETSTKGPSFKRSKWRSKLSEREDEQANPEHVSPSGQEAVPPRPEGGKEGPFCLPQAQNQVREEALYCIFIIVLMHICSH